MADSENDNKTINFDLRLVRRQTFRNFAVQKSYKLVIDSESVKGMKLLDILASLRELFDAVLEQALREFTSDDQFRVKCLIDSPALDSPIVVALMPRELMNSDVIMSEIVKTLQSKQELTMRDLSITVGTLRKIEVSRGVKFVSSDKNWNSLARKHSIIQIKPTSECDVSCMPRAVMVAYARVSDNSSEYKKRIADSSRRLQRAESDRLLRELGLPLDQSCDFSHVKLFEQHLGIRIVLMSAKMGLHVVYRGNYSFPKVIYLLITFNEDKFVYHADVITKIAGFMACDKWCDGCLKSVGPHHKCEYFCNMCLRKGGECVFDLNTRVSCIRCCFTMRNFDCYELHKVGRVIRTGSRAGTTGKSFCDKFKKCTACFSRIDVQKEGLDRHRCGFSYCVQCSQYKENGGRHFCFMRFKNPSPPSSKYIFVDFESDSSAVDYCSNPKFGASTVSTCLNCQRVSCGKRTHKPIYAIAIKVCDECIDNDAEDFKCMSCGRHSEDCEIYQTGCTDDCGSRVWEFKLPDVERKFCDWLYSPQHKGYTLTAYFLSGYDIFLFLSFLLNSGVRPSHMIFRGSRILTMTLGDISLRFIDAYLFFKCKLAKLPKVWGIENPKGRFPFKIINSSNMSLILDRIPSKEFYDCDSMFDDEREEFLKWHAAESAKNEPWSFQAELAKYTIQDAVILFQSSLRFRKLVMEKTGDWLDGKLVGGVDPLQCTTLASMCLTIYRYMYLTEEHEVFMADSQGNELLPVVGTMKKGVLRFPNPADFSEMLSSDTLTDETGRLLHTRFLRSPLVLLPHTGYFSSHNYSKISIQYLMYYENLLRESGVNVRIKSAIFEGEQRISLSGTGDPDLQQCCWPDGYYEHNGESFAIFFQVNVIYLLCVCVWGGLVKLKNDI